MRSYYTALLDANVLYPAPMRDLFLPLAVTDLFRAKWSADIHREWIEALLQREPHRERLKLERTRDLMDQATRDSLVTGYESIIPSLSLPDPDDRHVLAAAIVGHCDVIVTQNLRDFSTEELAPYSIETQHPDEFLHNLLSLAPGIFCSAVRKVRARLKYPPLTGHEYLENLTQVGLTATASELKQYTDLI
ncbi:MAG: PIN domain-containing protein [Chroococcidiopsidaceae cyanobacterium CP_BM_RX_35]|nr:PIN domain-containing protein [Chroococcidiopsidaceae cyanobacterium CP_BM_RX_35]